jgi:AcrR family transcriptional regulator
MVSINPNPRSRRGDRREQLLDGLEAIFLKEGFRDVTVEELASRLRCSRQTLYRVAPSKPEIFLTVLDRFLSGIRAEGREAAYSRSDPMQRIEALLEPGITATVPASRRFTEDVDGYEPARLLLAEHQRVRMRLLREIVDDGISRGAFSGFHAHLVAEVMVAAVGRVSRPDFLAEAGLSMSEAFDECSRLIRLGLARTGGEESC